MRKKGGIARTLLSVCFAAGCTLLSSVLVAQEYVFSSVASATEKETSREQRMSLRKFLASFEDQYAMKFVCKSQLLRMEIAADEGKRFTNRDEAERYLLERLRDYRFSVKKISEGQYAINWSRPRLTGVGTRLAYVSSSMDENYKAEKWQESVSGTVSDTAGIPLPGVTVLVKGTTVGTSTDENGAFTIQANENDVLVFSMVGFATQEVPVSMGGAMSITLQQDAQQLDEVVVVGYGTQKKAVVSGAVATVEGEDLTKSPTVNLTNTLVGRLPGVTAMQSSGEPGYDNSTIRIRGVNSLGNSDALVVIDGVPNRAGGLARINPADVENISILKDASAAIYGSRAANGVILVTTKRGQSGKPQLSYDFSYGLQQPTRVPKMSNAPEYATIRNELQIFDNLPSEEWQAAWTAFNAGEVYQRNDGGELGAIYSPDELQKFRDGSDPLRYPNTDWFGTTLRDWAPQQQHNLQISGGTDNVKYLASLGYQNQDGYYRESATGYKQYDLRLNLDAKITDFISARIGVNAREEYRHFPTLGAGDIFRMIMRGKPTEIEVWPNGLPGPDIEYGQNPYVITTDLTGYDRDKRDYFQTNGQVDITIPGVDGLKITGQAAIDKFSGRRKRWEKPWTLYYWDGNTFEDDGVSPALRGEVRSPFTDPRLREWAASELAVNLTGMVTYDRVIGDHTFNLLAGVQREEVDHDNFWAFRRYFISSLIDQLSVGGNSEQNIGVDNGDPYGLFQRARLSYFGRVGYNYKEKYLAEFLWRVDGSYIFPPDQRFGFFPGITLGWRISEEPFWKDNITFVDNLKIRGSWGQMGAEAYLPGSSTLAEYQYLASMGYGSYIIADQVTQSLSESNVANLNFGWEVANNMNLGLEASFLDYKLNLEFEYFNNNRTEILITRGGSIPGSSGIVDKLPPVNLGEVNNRGWEFQLGYGDQKGDFYYNVSVNGGYAKSKIEFWDETPGAPEWQRTTGRPINAFLLYQYDGVFRDQADIDANTIDYSAISGTLRPGDMKFKDVNNDGKIDGDDMVRMDQTNVPTFTGGLNINLQYRNFDLSVLFQGATGALQFVGLTESGDIGNYLKWSYDHRWTIDNPSSVDPRLANRGNTYYTNFSIAGENTYWARKNDYLRLKNVEIGYTLPANLTDRWSISNLRIYLSGLNLATWDEIKVWDPESTNSSGQYYPQARIINAGINVSF
ncbi:MAG: TonB-dependent receptor [Solitalea sp.]